MVVAKLEARDEAPPSQPPLVPAGALASDEEDEDGGASVINMASRVAPEPRVFVRSSCRFILSSCISLRLWLVSVRRRLRYQVTLA